MKQALVLLFVALAIATDPFRVYEKLNKPALEKRQAPIPCTSATCVGLNEQCSTSSCNSCLDPFNACLSTATNQTAVCACYTTASNCLRGQGGLCLYVLSTVYSSCPAGCCGAPVNYTLVQPVCSGNLYCDNTGDGRCKAPTPDGPCTSRSECGLANATIFESNQYVCENRTGSFRCYKEQNILAANDFCTTASDCVENIPCTGGRCQGKALGAACQSSDACDFGLYCNSSGLCAPENARGSNCTGDDTCTFGDFCINGVCSAANILPAGSPCNKHSSNECQQGLFCSQTTQVCTAVPAVLGSCLVDANCTSGTVCECNYYTGERKCSIGTLPLTPACDSLYQAALGCIGTNRCKGDISKDSCGERYCLGAVNCFYACVFTDPSFADIFGCQNVNFPCSTATSAGTPTSVGPTSAGAPTSVGPTSAGTPTSVGTPTSIGVSGTNGLSGTDTSSASFAGLSAALLVALTVLA